MARTILHVGAHKTATTYLQNRLDENQDLLKANNIHYPHIFETRKNLTYRASQPDNNLNPFTQGLVVLKEKGVNILLSDENFIGGVDDVIAIGRQYGHARAKLERYCTLLDADDPEIYFCVRDYASFVVSLYCEYLRHFPYVTFDDYYEMFAKTGFSWLDTVADLLAAAPNAKVKLWDFTHFRALEHVVLSDMLGFDSRPLKPLMESARDSFSDVAIRCIGALSEVLDFDKLRLISHEIARTFPKSAQYPKFDPLSFHEVSRLTSLYREDLEKLKVLSPRLSIFSPGDAPG